MEKLKKTWEQHPIQITVSILLIGFMTYKILKK